jgi:hypothetical protein
MREVLEIVDVELAIPVVALFALGSGMIVHSVRKRFR